MSYDCQILADSVSEHGHRLTTFQITFPRFILAEVNTHRMLSRNSASSRAIPVERSIQAIEEQMFVPEAFGAHQKGMSAEQVLQDAQALEAGDIWRKAGLKATGYARQLSELGVHKAWANRLLEPFKWHTAIVTATEWGNFFALRTDKNAQPEFQRIALMMQDAYEHSWPKRLQEGQWHTPLIVQDDMPLSQLGFTEAYKEQLRSVSVARCARVSVERHGTTRPHAEDVAMHDRLLFNRHLSPFEHVARPFSEAEWTLVRSLQEWIGYQSVNKVDLDHANYLLRQVEFQGNLRGWHSARMDVENERDYSLICDAVH